jgi:hypothetical protein
LLYTPRMAKLRKSTAEGRPDVLLSPPPRRQWVPKADVLKLLRTANPDPAFDTDIAELGELDDLATTVEQ